jgi:hypothetical protein
MWSITGTMFPWHETLHATTDFLGFSQWFPLISSPDFSAALLSFFSYFPVPPCSTRTSYISRLFSSCLLIRFLHFSSLPFCLFLFSPSFLSFFAYHFVLLFTSILFFSPFISFVFPAILPCHISSLFFIMPFPPILLLPPYPPPHISFLVLPFLLFIFLRFYLSFTKHPVLPSLYFFTSYPFLRHLCHVRSPPPPSVVILSIMGKMKTYKRGLAGLLHKHIFAKKKHFCKPLFYLAGSPAIPLRIRFHLPNYTLYHYSPLASPSLTQFVCNI